MMVYYFFALVALAVIFVSFLVISKTLGNIGIALLRMEYLLSREYELIKQKEEIKQKIEEQSQKKETTSPAEDKLSKIPYKIKS